MEPLMLVLGYLWWLAAGLVVVLWRWLWRGLALVAGAAVLWKVEREYESGHDAEVAARELQEQEMR